MDAQKLLTFYQSLAENHGLPPLDEKIWDLNIESKTLTSAVAAMKQLTTFEPVAGWLGFQSITHVLRHNEAIPEMNNITGTLLNAELVNKAGESLHIRYDSAGGWISTKFTPKSGDKYLADTVKLVIHVTPGGFLYYRRYWAIDTTPSKTHGIIHIAACFSAIKPE